MHSKKSALYGLFTMACLLFSVNAQATLNVFACEPEWAALVKELGGDKLAIYSATTAMQDPHHIQARPSLIAKARRADLLLCSGAELEVGWLPLLLRKASNQKIQPQNNGYFMASDYVSKLEVPESLDRSMGDVHAEGNPHIHTDPENILRVAEALADRLMLIDEAHKDFYQNNFQRFKDHWQQSIERWRQQIAILKGANIVTHHNYWSYLNNWAGIDVLATLEPIAGVSPSSSHLADVKKRMADLDVKMILHVSYVSERPAEWLSEKMSVPVVVLPASVNYQDGQTLSQWFSSVIDLMTAAVTNPGND